MGEYALGFFGDVSLLPLRQLRPVLLILQLPFFRMMLDRERRGGGPQHQFVLSFEQRRTQEEDTGRSRCKREQEEQEEEREEEHKQKERMERYLFDALDDFVFQSQRLSLAPTLSPLFRCVPSSNSQHAVRERRRGRAKDRETEKPSVLLLLHLDFTIRFLSSV